MLRFRFVLLVAVLLVDTWLRLAIMTEEDLVGQVVVAITIQQLNQLLVSLRLRLVFKVLQVATAWAVRVQVVVVAVQQPLVLLAAEQLAVTVALVTMSAHLSVGRFSKRVVAVAVELLAVQVGRQLVVRQMVIQHQRTRLQVVEAETPQAQEAQAVQALFMSGSRFNDGTFRKS
jgi:hypothetical protein